MKAFVIIDVQNGLMEKNLYEKEKFINNINKEIIERQKQNDRIIFIQHNSKKLKCGTFDWELFSKLQRSKDEIIIQKKHGDSFKDTKLKQILTKNEITDVIISGLVSHGCVYYTCKSGIENGFNVKVLKNGHTNWLKNAKEKITEVNNNLIEIGVELV